MHVIKRDGSSEPFDFAKIERLNEYATSGLDVDVDLLKSQIRFMVYDGMKTADIFDAQIKAASGLISRENPDFTYVAARYLLCDLYKRVNGTSGYHPLRDVIAAGLGNGRYSPRMDSRTFDFDRLEAAIRPERDFQFDYFGLQNVADRYLMRTTDRQVIELPQHFFMRVAMGVALNEADPTGAAIEFYELLSSFDFMSSTPTLFNAGTVRSQLSSCYLNTVADQISAEIEEGEDRWASIYGTIEESARLSKYAGGIGTSWTRVRGAGGLIHGTNGRSSGVVPYLKVYNDTAVAVNQGGKRKGSFAPYLESWHPDFMEFCELKKEFGDDRQRAHDIFPAAWLSDLFMERVQDKGQWSFFQPDLYPELHELHGDAFTRRYVELERAGAAVKQLPAVDVWKHILTNLFETGHPWITFKDECNRRNPQDHVGVVHSSNLCTEITLNTSDTETAVCNLGSVNLARHVTGGCVDHYKLQRTVELAVRMLDNVIDLNYYPSERARRSNLRHRPVGLGVMGYTEAMVACGIPWDSEEHLNWADELFENLSYFAISASCSLAAERGAYESFKGSKWDRGILPIDTARDKACLYPESWEVLRRRIRAHGMRNSNVMALAPTATISIITGATPTIEPIFEIERVEGNMSGTFKVIDPCVRYGRPELLKTVWEIAALWIVRAAARRQKWIDQSQSVNIFVRAGTKGRELAEIYMLAWEEGLKTTYYLRSQSRQVKKSQVQQTTVTAEPAPVEGDVSVQLCSIDNPNCESCQ
jgi:ribonucleoside-diphosphate reductase alpha chain